MYPYHEIDACFFICFFKISFVLIEVVTLGAKLISFFNLVLSMMFHLNRVWSCRSKYSCFVDVVPC
jgi:hypothetical protein